jgi:hypothetical protein
MESDQIFSKQGTELTSASAEPGVWASSPDEINVIPIDASDSKSNLHWIQHKSR